MKPMRRRLSRLSGGNSGAFYNHNSLKKIDRILGDIDTENLQVNYLLPG
jgi:hypothetical protein